MFGIFKKDINKAINVNDLDNLIEKIDLIDIREKYEYNRGRIRTSKNIPMNELLNNTDKYLKKDKEYYIVCQSGGRSARTCSSLRAKGYNVVNVSGGVGSYLGKYRE
ncbi:rhodanese-like domain-containing protein [Caproiciproducens sp. MSJ-32]|uniref:rhodanese-like domain-containing protein n=1 Tax=Caproiciproducens sp. MSJ-32 TaxID=2841527 RepID=UPI001C106424|nr:rhodanese-like domain-containing protein [Caproiciproducens sp. MSJ-32]MBU5454394.1 rhodanese-like domain-containing protein [Caproiciproducens sp. MSJ-32]